MYNQHRTRGIPVGGVWIVLCLAGCIGTSPAPRQFILPAGRDPEPVEAAAGLSLVVARSELPVYLDNPHIATRTANHEIVYAPFSRWAEPLDLAVTNALAANLAALLGSHSVFAYPENSPEAKYSVRIGLTRFERTDRDTVVATGSWTVRDTDTGRLLARRGFALVQPVTENEIEATVAALGRCLVAVAREVADFLARSPPP